MSAPLPESASDRRGYFRVQTRLRLGLRPVAAGEIEPLRLEILQREASARPRVDPALADWLTRIEEKLDLLLQQSGCATAGMLRKEERSVVLSGSGLLLPGTSLRCDLGATLLVELDLPLRPRHTVRCLAVVAGYRPEPDGHTALALGFCCIHEEDRDAIVRHTLVVERRELGQRPGGPFGSS
jgi:hypothetical protein